MAQFLLDAVLEALADGLCQGGLSGHLVVNGQMYATRHTDYNVGTDQGPRESRVYRRTLTGLG